MCDMVRQRASVNRILIEAISEFTQRISTNKDNVTYICFDILQTHYCGLCSDEAMLEKARSFASWYISRQEQATISGPGRDVISLLAA